MKENLKKKLIEKYKMANFNSSYIIDEINRLIYIVEPYQHSYHTQLWFQRKLSEGYTIFNDEKEFVDKDFWQPGKIEYNPNYVPTRKDLLDKVRFHRNKITDLMNKLKTLDDEQIEKQTR